MSEPLITVVLCVPKCVLELRCPAQLPAGQEIIIRNVAYWKLGFNGGYNCLIELLVWRF